jgi:hypothetical protein
MYVVDTEALLAIADGEKRYEESSKAFKKCRIALSADIKQTLKEGGSSASEFSALLGMDAGGISRRLRSAFAVPLNKVEQFAYGIMGKSCHELFSAESNRHGFRGCCPMWSTSCWSIKKSKKHCTRGEGRFMGNTNAPKHW